MRIDGFSLLFTLTIISSLSVFSHAQPWMPNLPLGFPDLSGLGIGQFGGNNPFLGSILGYQQAGPFCEGSQVSISCPDSTLIQIQNVFYGRQDTSTCTIAGNGDTTNTRCSAFNAISDFGNQCNGRKTCSFPLNGAVVADPCPSTATYAMVTYSCTAAQSNQLREVSACQGESVTLSCDGGKVLSIAKGFYGRQYYDVCPINGTASSSSSSSTNYRCSSSDADSKIKSKCSGQTSCSVTFNSQSFQDGCQSTSKYGYIQYSCVPKPICGGDTVSLTCPAGQVLAIASAFYGRTDNTFCPTGSSSSSSSSSPAGMNMFGAGCSAPNALELVRNQCSGRVACQFPLNGRVLPEPCSQGRNYAQIEYTCIDNPTPQISSACQNQTAYLNCPSNQIITLDKSFYGRQYYDVCPDAFANNFQCESSGAGSYVKSQCANKNACSLYVSDSTLGEACTDTSKYGLFQYRCIG